MIWSHGQMYADETDFSLAITTGVLTSLAFLLFSKDIFSYNKEQSRGDTHNLVAVIMEERQLDLQSAMNLAGELCHQSISKFEADRRSLPSWGKEIDRDVELYVQGLQDWIVGSLHWSFVTKRYFGTEGESVKRHRTIQLLPRRKDVAVVEQKGSAIQRRQTNNVRKIFSLRASVPQKINGTLIQFSQQILYLFDAFWAIFVKSFFNIMGVLVTPFGAKTPV